MNSQSTSLCRSLGEFHFVHLNLIIDQFIDIYCCLQAHTTLPCARLSCSKYYLLPHNVPCNCCCRQSRGERISQRM